VETGPIETGRSNPSFHAALAKIELAASDVSMDQLVRAFTAAGGRIVVKTAKAKARQGQKASGRKDTLVLEVATCE
jgi:hypothetical protein